MRRYRILHVLGNLEAGGGQMLTLRAVTDTDPHSFSHYVAALAPPDTMAPRLREAGAEVIAIGHRGPLDFASGMARLVRFARERRIDLVHTNNTRLERLYGHGAALMLGLPAVESLHALSPPPTARLRRALRRLEGRVSGQRIIRGVVATSEAVRQSRRWYLDSLALPAERVRVIHPGIRQPPRLAPLARRALVEALGLQGAEPVLVNVGRLVPGKGQILLLPMMRRVRVRWPTATLLIVGEGPERSALEQAIHASSVSDAIRLLGFRDDVAALLALADVFVFPSFEESFGLALLEAMAAGVPAVAFDLAAFAEFFATGSHGHLVPLGDGERMTQALLDLLDDRIAARSMGDTACMAVVHRFSAERAAAQLQSFYALILEKFP